jgi:hypothetical protein
VLLQSRLLARGEALPERDVTYCALGRNEWAEGRFERNA